MTAETKTVHLDIMGMRCASCASSIEKALQKIPGVLSAEVNLITHSATITTEPEVEASTLIQAVSTLGYQVSQSNNEDLTATGGPIGHQARVLFFAEVIHCASCAAHIESKLKTIDGVSDVTVDVPRKQVTVLFDPKKTTPDALIAATTSIGYPMVIASGKTGATLSQLTAQNRKVAAKRMITAWLLLIPSVLIMFSHLHNDPMGHMLMLLLNGIIVFWCGKETLKAAGTQALHFNASMDTLISLGALTALLSGLLSLAGIPTSDFTMVAGMIMAIHLTGRYLEEGARAKATAAVEQLAQVAAKTALLEKGEQLIEVPIEQLMVGDIVQVKPGDKIPQDGQIIEGTASIEESMITGEPIPVTKIVGDQVIGATLNLDGHLRIKINHIGGDAFLSQIVRLVSQAQGTKVPIQAFADKVTRIFVPIVLLLAIGSFVTVYFAGDRLLPFYQWMSQWLPWVNPNTGVLPRALSAAIATLVIACPCALGLATPMALAVGMGRAAKKGILFTHGEAVQTMNDIDVVLLDKTGTVTAGHFRVEEYVQDSTHSTEQILSVLEAFESRSNHPISRAIVDYIKTQPTYQKSDILIDDFEAVGGFGLKGKIEGITLYSGKPDWALAKGIAFDSLFNEAIAKAKSEGATVTLLFDDEKIWCCLVLSDEIKSDAIKSISRLKANGKHIVLLTGDHQTAANRIGQQLSVDRVIAEVLPQDKMHIVKEYQQKGQKVAMVGDGINDAPALKQANVGIAMGSGTQIAQASSDIILVRQGLSALPEAFATARTLFTTIRQNLFWAFFYNLMAIPLAFIGLLHPIIAEAAMAFSSITVSINSLIKRKDT